MSFISITKNYFKISRCPWKRYNCPKNIAVRLFLVEFSRVTYGSTKVTRMDVPATEIVSTFLRECGKLRALRAVVPYVSWHLACPRALCALVPCVPSHLACSRALRVLVPYVPSYLTCFRALPALAPCVPSCLAYLACLTCLACPRTLKCIKVYLGCFWNSRASRNKSCSG